MTPPLQVECGYFKCGEASEVAIKPERVKDHSNTVSPLPDPRAAVASEYKFGLLPVPRHVQLRQHEEAVAALRHQHQLDDGAQLGRRAVALGLGGGRTPRHRPGRYGCHQPERRQRPPVRAGVPGHQQQEDGGVTGCRAAD